MSKDSNIGNNRCSEEAGKSQRNPEYSINCEFKLFFLKIWSFKNNEVIYKSKSLCLVNQQ